MTRNPRRKKPGPNPPKFNGGGSHSPTATSQSISPSQEPPEINPLTVESSSPKKKRITFDVDPDLHTKTYLFTRRQGTTIKDLLTNFLEEATIDEQI